MVTATMLVDGVAGLTMQKSMHLSMVVSIVVEMVEQTAAVATVVAMAFEEHEGGHTGDGVVDGDGVAQWVTVTVGMVEEGGGKDGCNERLEEWGLSDRIVGSRTNDRRAGSGPAAHRRVVSRPSLPPAQRRRTLVIRGACIWYFRPGPDRRGFKGPLFVYAARLADWRPVGNARRKCADGGRSSDRNGDSVR